ANKRLEGARDLLYRVKRSGSAPESERNKAQSEYEAELINVNNFTERLKILEDRQAKLEVRSPITGHIITWDVKKMLDKRPVGVGQILMTVAADDTEYEAELYMPERRVKHVVEYRNKLKTKDPSKDLSADFILMTDPGISHR